METKVIRVRGYFDTDPDEEHRYQRRRYINKRKQRLHPASIIISAFIVILAASFPVMSLWFANQGEVGLMQALLPAAVFVLAGLIIFFVILPITRRPYFSGVYSAFAIFLLADFQIVRNLVRLAIKAPAEQYVSGALGIIILVGVFLLLYKLTKEVWLRYAVRIATITLASVMMLSFIMGNPSIAFASGETVDDPEPTVAPTVQVTPTPTIEPTSVPTVSATPAPTPVIVNDIVYANPELESSKLPNVYCFVLDEYAPPRTTAKYYGFDNSFFINYLKEHRFNISSTSLCNEPETSWATGELNRLLPFLKEVSGSKARSYRKKNALLYTSFQSLGYSTYSNSAMPRLFPTNQLKDNMDALVDLSELDREPPLMAAPAESPAVTLAPTATPAPTPTINIFVNLDEVEVDTDWRDEFFTSVTENDENMYDLTVKMSVLSLFIDMSDKESFEDEDEDEVEDVYEADPAYTPEPELTDSIPEDMESVPSPTPEITTVETTDPEEFDGEDDEDDGFDQGVSAPLNPDYASDPVPYDQLKPIPKRLSVHGRDLFNVLSRLEQLRTKGFEQPTFLINYTRTPHVPFMFDKYGNQLKSNVRYWWKNPNYYLGQLKFLTTHMMHVIDTILETDPDCVIIIQSDHGLRYRQLVFPFPEGVTKDKKDQYYIINYVYYRGQVLDIEGLSPINTYRTVLTKLGLDMPLVEDPRALEFRGEKYGIPDDDPRLANIINN